MPTSKIKVACIQINADENTDANIDRALRLTNVAAQKNARLALLPEVFHYRGDRKKIGQAALTLKAPLIKKFQRAAAGFNMGILLGSVLEKSGKRGKFYNTSVLISEKGRITAVYRKIHLFDIDLRGEVKVSESEYILPGRKKVVSQFRGIKAGLSICYDLRFPELYRELTARGAEMIFVPSNFTETTGKAHWETLLRARAIENQVFVIAPAQCGKNVSTGIKSFGTSLIVDPWGRILARGSSSGEEIILAELDFGLLRKLRRQFPVLTHAGFDC